MDATAKRVEHQRSSSAVDGGETKYRVGDKDNRPWGAWAVLDVGSGFIVKRIHVSPGQRLSLQYHFHRAEDWIIIAGRGIVEISGKPIEVGPGVHVHIPATATHRISNTSDEVLTFVEIQRGDILDETDIVRLSDDYGR